MKVYRFAKISITTSEEVVCFFVFIVCFYHVDRKSL